MAGFTHTPMLGHHPPILRSSRSQPAAHPTCTSTHTSCQAGRPPCRPQWCQVAWPPGSPRSLCAQAQADQGTEDGAGPQTAPSARVDVGGAVEQISVVLRQPNNRLHVVSLSFPLGLVLEGGPAFTHARVPHPKPRPQPHLSGVGLLLLAVGCLTAPSCGLPYCS